MNGYRAIGVSKQAASKIIEPLFDTKLVHRLDLPRGHAH